MKILKLMSGIAVLMMLTSCGRTVQPMGENKIVTSTTTEPMITGSIIAPKTTVTELTTQTTTAGKPQRVEIDTDMPANYNLKKSFVIDGFETVMQEPELPTGCEVTALTQTMQFYGFDVDKVELCDVFMPIDHEGYYTMNEAYLGDPHATNGFGCNAPVIVNTADDYFEYIGSDWYAKNISEMPLEEVLYQVEQGRPVVVWTTIGQRETISEFQFILGCGEEFWFNPFQHCVTIYGYDYDAGLVYIADPLEGNMEYNMEIFERIYEIMEKQAVILIGNKESAGKIYSTKDEQKKWLEKNRPEDEEETDINTEVTE